MSYQKTSSVLSQYLQRDITEKDQQKAREEEKNLNKQKEKKMKKIKNLEEKMIKEKKKINNKKSLKIEKLENEIVKKEKTVDKVKSKKSLNEKDKLRIKKLEDEIVKKNETIKDKRSLNEEDKLKIKEIENKIIKINENIELKPPPNSCTKHIFRPDKELISTLNRWFGCCRKTYNNAVKYINENFIEKKKKKINKDELKILRKECIEKEGGIPYDPKDNELRKAINAFKHPGRKNLLKFRSKKHMFRETFSIPHKHLKLNSGVYIELVNKILPFIKYDINIKNINYEVLISKTKTGIYSLNIPIRKPTVEKIVDTQNNLKVVSIDPGVRSPFTCYDPSGECFKISEDKIENLYEYCLERDEINSKISHLKNSKGKCNDSKSFSEKKHYRKICRKINRLILAGFKIQERINNLRKQFHYDSIKHLLGNYDVVILPEFKTKQMMKKEKRKLNEEGVRKLGLWSHYTFRQRLIQKSEFLGKHVIITDEDYTTKTCGNCGELNKITTEKEFTCKKCKINLDRDINASRNILLRFLSKLSLN